jgi:hypothetical protein
MSSIFNKHQLNAATTSRVEKAIAQLALGVDRRRNQALVSNAGFTAEEIRRMISCAASLEGFYLSRASIRFIDSYIHSLPSVGKTIK